MDWTQLDTALPALVSTLIELPCDFVGKARPMHQQARAQLGIIATSAIGVDEQSLDLSGEDTLEAPTAQRIAETVHGLREMTVQVDVWSNEQSIDKSSRRYLERLRTRLRWTSSIEALKALGLALVEIEDIAQPDVEENGRRYSFATMDVRLAYGESETDAAVPFIEQFRLRTSDDMPAELAIDTDVSLTE